MIHILGLRTVFILCFLSSAVSADWFNAVSDGLKAGYEPIFCSRTECCNDRWISTDFTDLKVALETKLYGQHLVIDSVMKHLQASSKYNPRKALALSFHGGPGTGKNFVSQIVAEKMFKKGMKSKYVHLISATKEFPHDDKVYMYKDKLKDLIEARVKECPRSFFIIDQMDCMPPGIIDTLKPYLDFYDNLDGVDYKKAMFFLLSNTAAHEIGKRTMEQWENNLEREDITLAEMEEVIRLPAFNSESGLWHSRLIASELITAYVPFLPLERRHVKQCIRDGLISKGYYKSEEEITEVVVQEIADQLPFIPKGYGIFSGTGCKRVLQKIDEMETEIHDQLVK